MCELMGNIVLSFSKYNILLGIEHFYGGYSLPFPSIEI